MFGRLEDCEGAQSARRRAGEEPASRTATVDHLSASVQGWVGGLIGRERLGRFAEVLDIGHYSVESCRKSLSCKEPRRTHYG